MGGGGQGEGRVEGHRQGAAPVPPLTLQATRSSPFIFPAAADPANPAALCEPVSNTTIDPPANSYPVFSLLGAPPAGCAAPPVRLALPDLPQTCMTLTQPALLRTPRLSS